MISAENVAPDTLPLVESARSLAGIPRGKSLVPYRNIGEIIARRAAETPEREFLSFHAESGRLGSYTCRDLHESAARVASLLRDSLGIRAGDRIATLMTNDSKTALIYFGAWMLGATVVPVNCGEDDDRIRFILDNSEAKAVFAHPEQAARFSALLENPCAPTGRIQVGGEPAPGFQMFDDLLAARVPLSPLPDVPADQECLIVYTSGTTGAPKGVALEQYNLMVDARAIAEWHRFGPDDRAMCVLPIHHVNGIVVTLMTPLYSGGSVALNARFSAARFWQTLADERCTWVSVVPTVLAFLCENPSDLGSLDLSRFRHLICGAGPLTVELARRFEETFRHRIVHGYGLSETTCYSCFLPVDLSAGDHAHWMLECGFPSIGCPMPVNEMAIHDAEGRPLPEDARGEIVIRGHNVMRWYFRRPDANASAFTHGWFRSGDEGFYRTGPDDRRYFFITGRLKELIIRGGVNYSPFDIDEVLNRIPGVKAAMAVGFENDFYGEEVGAYVQRSEGSTLTADDVIKACSAELPFSKRPKVVVFGETFPVTSTGKYQRNRLKPLFAEWKSHQFRKG